MKKLHCLCLLLLLFLLAGCGDSSEVEQVEQSNKDFAEICSVMYEMARAKESSAFLVNAEMMFYSDSENYPLTDWADECLDDIDRIYTALGKINREVLTLETGPNYEDIYDAFNHYAKAFIRHDEVFRLLIESPDNKDLKNRFDESQAEYADAQEHVDLCARYFFREYCSYRDIGLYPPYEDEEVSEVEDAEEEMEETIEEVDDGIIEDEAKAAEEWPDHDAVYTANYVVNENSKVFHLPECEHVSQLSEENKTEKETTRDQLVAEGYRPCEDCEP